MMRPKTFRKALILIAMGFSSFTESYMMGHTASLIAALFQEKDDLQMSEGDISWIMSLLFTSMTFGTFLATLVTEKIGRRITVVVFMIPTVVSLIILYYARSAYVFMASRFLAGIGFGGALPVVYMITAECSSPKMRGFNLAIITTVMPAIGGMAGKNLGIGLNWRTAALIGVAPALLATILPFFCVESPSWLASKGRFDECEAAFTSLHGLKHSAQKELQLILEVEKAKFNSNDKTTHTIKIIYTRLKVAAKKWYFWKLMFLTSVITIYKTISGRILFGSYGVIILQKLSGQTDVLLYTLTICIIGVLGSGLTIVMLKKMYVRSLLFPSGILNCVILIALALSLYVLPDNYDSFILVLTNVSLYIVHFSLVIIILFPVLEALPVELYPLEIRGACNTIVGAVGAIFVSVFLKVTPAMLALVDFYGVFLINAVTMLVLLSYLWMQLPETKGRTLHEIELSVMNEKHCLKRDSICTEQSKELI